MPVFGLPGLPARDRAFLLAGAVMDEQLIQNWTEYKLTREYLQVRDRLHAYEVEPYFDV